MVYRKFGRKCESIHFTHFMEEANTLESLFRERDGKKLDSQAVFIQLAELFSRLHRDGYIHGDAKLSNLLRHNNKLYLVDLDGFKPLSSKWVPARDIARLLVGFSEQGCSMQEMLFLFDRYCDLSGLCGESFRRQVRPIIGKLQAKHKKKYGIEPGAIL